MKWRPIRRAPGKPGVLIALCGPGVDADKNGIGDLDEAIAFALPELAIAASSDSGYGAPISDVEAGLRACGASSLGVLAGFSAGCQFVRQQLFNGLDPALVIGIDGCAGPWDEKKKVIPTPCREVDVWRDRIAAGRPTVITATSQRYTQRLPRVAGQQPPYAATSTMLARIFDWPEAEQLKALTKPLAVYPGQASLELHRESAHAFVFPGTDCDKDAHIAQLVQVLPEMLRRYAAPLFGFAMPEPSWTVGGSLAQLASDIAEWAGDAFGSIFEGAPIPSHGWRCSVAESIADAKANGKWHPKGSDYKPKRGDVICGARAGEEPEQGGRGHYETITAIEDDHDPTTIGGNENNRYEVAVYRWDNSAFRGVIEVDARIGDKAVALALEEKRKGVQEIPGPGAHPQIQAYHAGARRGGSRLAGMPGFEKEGVQVLGSKAPDEVDWCASSGGWRMYQAAKALAA